MEQDKIATLRKLLLGQKKHCCNCWNVLLLYSENTRVNLNMKIPLRNYSYI